MPNNEALKIIIDGVCRRARDLVGRADKLAEDTDAKVIQRLIDDVVFYAEMCNAMHADIKDRVDCGDLADQLASCITLLILGHDKLKVKLLLRSGES
jgi:hypothetical protein